MPRPSARSYRHVPPAIVSATDPQDAGVLRHGRLMLLSDPGGDVVPDRRGLGLYEGDTRVGSCLALRLRGVMLRVQRPDPSDAGSGSIVLTGRTPAADREEALDGLPASETLTVVRARTLGDSLSERVTIEHRGPEPVALTLELLVDADMADIFEIRGFDRARRGTFESARIAGEAVTLGYLGLDGRRRRTLFTAPGATIEPGAQCYGAAATASWQLVLGPGGSLAVGWSVSAEIEPVAGRATPTRRRGRIGPPRTTDAPGSPAAGQIASPETGRAWIRSDEPALNRVVARAIADLDLLTGPGPAPGSRHIVAGIQWFAALFGRDAIFASYGALIVDPSLAVDTLRALAAAQATEDDPSRDAEPGKIPHEVRDGEMATTGEVPFGRYYGSVDATPLWLVLLGEVWDWTADRALVAELWPAALAALDWLDRFADIDGDGFIESARRSPGGLPQGGWKDAPDSIQDRSGVLATGPIALAEVQGYAFDAWRRMARLARVVGDERLAADLEWRAVQLRRRFEHSFWVSDRAAYALALDGAKRPMDALGSNMAHALWSGIVGRRRAGAVASHLASAAFDSGWGLRTLASSEAGHDPLGYHTGSVWPHDTALAVAGLAGAGQADGARHLGSELIAAANALPDARLPELFAGFDRVPGRAPARYPGACAPQAWAAAAPLLVLRALLGLRPDAGRRRLDVIRPRLPEGVGELEIGGLRVGEARVDLRITASGGRIRLHVSPRDGDLTVVRRG